MSKTLMEMAAEIVQGQVVGRGPMSTEQIVSSLKDVFAALLAMKRAESDDIGSGATESGVVITRAYRAPNGGSPGESIREETVVCLECGSEMKQITAKHLQTHGMTLREYKKKWGFPMRQSLASRSLTRARSKAGKKRGLPEALRVYLDTRKKMKDTVE